MTRLDLLALTAIDHHHPCFGRYETDEEQHADLSRAAAAGWDWHVRQRTAYPDMPRGRGRRYPDGDGGWSETKPDPTVIPRYRRTGPPQLG